MNSMMSTAARPAAASSNTTPATRVHVDATGRRYGLFMLSWQRRSPVPLPPIPVARWSHRTSSGLKFGFAMMPRTVAERIGYRGHLDAAAHVGDRLQRLAAQFDEP